MSRLISAVKDEVGTVCLHACRPPIAEIHKLCLNDDTLKLLLTSEFQTLLKLFLFSYEVTQIMNDTTTQQPT